MKLAFFICAVSQLCYFHLMNSVSTVIIIGIAFFCATRAKAEEATSKHPTYVICKNHKIVRTLRVEQSGSACKTLYTKAGIDREVGNGKNLSSCFKFMDNVRGNLGTAGWTCKDISDSTISKSGPGQ